MSGPWCDELERKASNLRSLIAALADRIENNASLDRDVVADNLLDIAGILSVELHAFTLEDPDHWGIGSEGRA